MLLFIINMLIQLLFTMKNIFFSLMILSAIILACDVKKEIKKESVLDNVSSLQDSIYYQIDSLPMLCEELNMNGNLVNIGDCNLYCEVKGNGTPMVVINGGPGGTHHYFHPWFGTAEKFAKVIYYDQRGCGQSDFAKGEGYTFKQAVDDLDKLRDKLGIEQWVICGYSYGGALAQYYSTVYPERVKGIVLISASPVLQDEELDKTRQYDYISVEEEKRIDELYDLYSKRKLSFFQLLYNKDINGDWKRQNFYKPTKEETIRAALYEWVNDKGFNSAVGGDYHGYDFKGVFENNPIPTLICEGKWDLTWSEKKAGIISKNHPNAKLVMFENSGHNIYNEEPELFFSTLKSFIKTLSPVSEDAVRNWKQHANDIISPQVEFFKNEKGFFKIINEQGIDYAYEYYTNFKKKTNELLFKEDALNQLGYNYLTKKDYPTAIKIFEMNADAYPDAWNVYDSLGEAYLESGNKKQAKVYYEKSLELNPDNKYAKEALKDL